MKDILEEFKIVFGFDDKPLQKGVKKTSSTLKGLATTFGAVFSSLAVLSTIKSLTAGFAEMNVKLGEQSTLLGINASELSSLGGALQHFGGSTESTASSLKSLSNHLEQAKLGQGALLEVSRKYGLQVNPYAKPLDVLKQLSTQMSNFSNQQRIAIAQQLGLDDSIARAFGDPKELERQIERQKKWGTATDEDVKIAKKFASANLDIKSVFSALSRDFSRLILPALTKLLDLFVKFIEWVQKHKQLVVIFFGALLVAMSPVLIMLGKMAFASLKAFAPFLAVGAVLAGITLVLEDIYAYFMGWDSVTGDLVQKFPVIGTILEGIRPLVEGIASTFGAIVDWLKNPSWESFKNIFVEAGKGLYNFLIQPFEAFMDIFDSWWNSIKNIGGMISGWLPWGNKNKEEKEKTSSENKDVPENKNVPKIELNAPVLEVPKIEMPKVDLEVPKIELNAPEIKNIEAPAVPMQSSVVNNSNSSNNINVNNNFNQNISSATPEQLASSTNSQIVQSIDNVRQQMGSL